MLSLLEVLYEKSFPKVLGIAFESSSAVGAGNLHEYLAVTCPPEKHGQILAALTRYRSETAPGIKTEPLRRFILEKVGYRPTRLLDFGSGSGEIARYLLSQLGTLGVAYCIDDDGAIHPGDRLNPNGPGRLVCLRDIADMTPPGGCDLGIAIHALHHVREEDLKACLTQIHGALTSDSVLFVYEDSWAAGGSLPDAGLPELDGQFEVASVIERRAIFTANDFWANHWCYGRSDNLEEGKYKSLEDWTALIGASGFSVLETGVQGFDPRRLHGVPACWVIAKKKPSER